MKKSQNNSSDLQKRESSHHPDTDSEWQQEEAVGMLTVLIAIPAKICQGSGEEKHPGQSKGSDLIVVRPLTGAVLTV